MSKVKFFLKAGLLVKFRNGQYGITDRFSEFGRIMRVYDGKLKIYNTSDWEDVPHRHTSNSDLDIISVWEIETIEEYATLCDQLGDSSLINQWTESRASLGCIVHPAGPRADEAKVEGDDVSNDICVRTSLTIKINDKPVDLNNLSPEERNILAQFGII